MVGVDIGCGMLAVKTSLTEISTEALKDILGGIRRNIPVGMRHHKEPQQNKLFGDLGDMEDYLAIWANTIVCRKEFENARKQLGTLGGGNHFIEIQKGDDGHIWFMIHSGSRNLGFKVANYYNNLAEEINLKFKQDEVVKNDLAFLPQGTPEFDYYVREMELSLRFAYENRQKMSELIKIEFERVCGGSELFESEINIHHNYAALEAHYGRNVWVHRKGAVLARKGTVGIIAGSQGTASYIVEGLGNAVALNTCSHGAGRKMSRKKARQTLNLEDEKAKLESKGILHGIRNAESLDEAAGAYKDIELVMSEQADLVKILVKLEPLAVVKE